MIDEMRKMPAGVGLLLLFGLSLLAVIGLTLPVVIGMAVDAPVSPLGFLWMLLLAYLIFTLTLVLQRKQAAWMLGLGLATLSVPVAAILFFWAGLIGGLVGALIVAILFWSLRRPTARAWFSEP